MNAVELDGCNLVILRERAGVLGGYDVTDSGVLVHDGEILQLERSNGTRRAVTENEQREIMVVTLKNGIRECDGFRLFILRP